MINKYIILRLYIANGWKDEGKGHTYYKEGFEYRLQFYYDTFRLFIPGALPGTYSHEIRLRVKSLKLEMILLLALLHIKNNK